MTLPVLRLRTEFSFRKAYGPVQAVVDRLKEAGATTAAITDTNGTWGHVAWSKACKKAGLRAIFGVELSVVPNATVREKQTTAQVILLARNAEGLQELYALTTRANSPAQFYYFPRLDYQDLLLTSDNLIVAWCPGAIMDRIVPRETHVLMLTPSNSSWNRRAMAREDWTKVVASENHYLVPEDKAAYEVLAMRDVVTRPTAMHWLDEDELRLAVPEATDAVFLATERIASMCTATLAPARNIEIRHPQTLYEQCIAGALARGMPVDAVKQTDGTVTHTLDDPIYQARLERELAMIAQKQFTDYFNLVGDMVRWAKRQLLVGQARGSSAGSLVCFLLEITAVEPILHDLMFERFIDVTRNDLPDIDIDFQDDRRELVFTYLRETYGEERVGRLGTVARLKAKSSLGDVAKALNIPSWEIRDLQEAVIERSSGDARAQFAVMDALESLDVGRKLLEKYPGMRMAAKLEAHAQHTGKHAAGIIVSQDRIQGLCSIDNAGQAQIDKKDAEVLNMLKIDALGLRTLSIIQDTLDQIGKDRAWLVNYPLADEKAFAVLNEERYSGIFQFEGYALQSLCRQMKVHSFDDVQVIGALARPGPLHCGAANEFIERRTGKQSITYMHPLCAPATRSTYGIVIYQEQVMGLCRDVGQLSWEDVAELRKAMSKTLGDEFFNSYWERFAVGALDHGIPSAEARRIWDKICTFGSWAFNKSHSVSYGLISYWCCVLKAHYPLEFAAASLRNEKDNEQGVRILRDLSNEGFQYRPVDPDHSELHWSVHDGKLLGGLTNIKGIGESKAKDILLRRKEGRPLLPGQRKLLSDPRTPYDDIFPAKRRFGQIYLHPKDHRVTSGPVSLIKDITDPGDYVFIGRLREKNLRDMNEYHSVVKRGGRIIKRDPLFLNMVLEDDTGTIIARIDRYSYKQWGLPLIEKARIDEWFMWRGTLKDDGWRVVNVQRWRCLEPDHPLNPTKPS